MRRGVCFFVLGMGNMRPQTYTYFGDRHVDHGGGVPLPGLGGIKENPGRDVGGEPKVAGGWRGAVFILFCFDIDTGG